MISTINSIIAEIIILIILAIPIIAICTIIYTIETSNNKNKNKKKNTTKTIKKSIKNKSYTESEYYKETGIEYNEMITDKGKAGEYSTSVILEKIQGERKFVFNIYIPREDNKTTEIDIIMIHENGIFVVENKNFKGWIIGDETHDQWCEITWRGKNQKKYFFYNPIRQNCNHIKNLKKIIGEKEINSIIVFNNEAQLKKITNSNLDISVINAKSIIPTIVKKLNKSEITYTKEEIDNIYNELKKYSEKNISDEIKEKHIEDIKEIK